MVAVTRPLADSLADAADPQHWLAGLAPQYSPAEFALLEKVCWQPGFAAFLHRMATK
jgi:hypothetical protein